MRAYLIYHPQRQVTSIGDLVVYHDNFEGNEDPYLWNDQFLHTFCHITQLSNEPNQINFWISGDSYPNFNELLCDCVFVTEKKYFWSDANRISLDDDIIDSSQAFEHHYKWYSQHVFEKRRRYTLKAHRDKSFQPQTADKKLIDVLPFLENCGINRQQIINQMTSKRGSRPMELDDEIGVKLYDYLLEESAIKLFGKDLKDLHP